MKRFIFFNMILLFIAFIGYKYKNIEFDCHKKLSYDKDLMEYIEVLKNPNDEYVLKWLSNNIQVEDKKFADFEFRLKMADLVYKSEYKTCLKLNKK